MKNSILKDLEDVIDKLEYGNIDRKYTVSSLTSIKSEIEDHLIEGKGRKMMNKSNRIITGVHKKNSPKPLKVDSGGREIKVGLEVYYNKSGEICKGIIEEIVKNKWTNVREGSDGCSWWSMNFAMKVLGEDGTISVIKNPNSFKISDSKEIFFEGLKAGNSFIEGTHYPSVDLDLAEFEWKNR